MIKYFKCVGLFLLFISCGALSGYAQSDYNEDAYTPNERPKLVVGIVVDQMRYEYIPRFWDKFGEGGFKRLVNKGYLFTNHHYNYFPTYTGPGHAAVYSGTTPAVNGIVGNSWYDRDQGQSMYVVSDSTAETIGAPGDAGHMSPANLLSTTVTDELKKAIAGSRVIAVSIKDRASILPGGHLANGAFWYDYDTGNFITSSWYMDELPDWVQAFNEQELPQQYSEKVWETLLPLDEYTESNDDDTPYEGSYEDGERPVFPHEMDGSLSRIIASPYGNKLVAALAKAAIDGGQLGSDEVTDFLTVSFSSTDYVGHQFGPNSIEVEDTYLRLDRQLAGLLSYLDEKVGEGNYLLFLTADHAAVQVPASLVDRGLPGGYFDSDTAIDELESHLKDVYGEGEWVVSYMNQQVYLNRELIKQQDLSLELMQHEAAQFLRQFEGVASTNTAYNYASEGYSKGLQAIYQRGFYYGRSGDVYVQLNPGWLDSSGHTGTSHGSPYSYDTHVPLIFYGWHVPHGITKNKTVIPQIAPTVSQMLQIQFPSGSRNHLLEFE